MSSNVCLFCECPDVDCEYLNVKMCYECFKKQMSHYLYDEPLEDISAAQEERLIDFMFDIDYKV